MNRFYQRRLCLSKIPFTFREDPDRDPDPVTFEVMVTDVTRVLEKGDFDIILKV